MISIILNTVRSDNPMVNCNWFIFHPTVKSLNKQESKNFELIIVDALYSEKRKKWLEDHAEFPVKYLNAFPNRYLESGFCAIASQKNKGLLYAENDLVMFIDDCTSFNRDWTKKIEYWFSKGYWPMSLTYYFECDKPKLLKKDDKYVEKFYGKNYDKTKNLFTYIKPGEIVRDSRVDIVNRHGTIVAPSQWFYGGSSAELNALLEVNGVDEKFDAKKGLEDVDLGLRLELAGYKGLFILDKDLYHYEHWHKPTSEKILFYKGSTPACNYALLQYNQVKKFYQANKNLLTFEDCLWIRDNICPKCPNLKRCLNEEFKGRFFIESEGFRKWLKLQKTFSLREMRLNAEL